MKLIYKILLAIFFVCNVFSLMSQSQNRAYLDYIENYHQLAVRQQSEYGIPASITLAQGLLESSAGQSDFVKRSNNHFGIKCTDWNGDRVYHDDDQKGECFRKYDHVIQSYEDHSLFLKNRKRYAFLFSLQATDYEGWAFGLKKAGYATDPSYAYKLISIIENYNLHRFDFEKDSDNGMAMLPGASTVLPAELHRTGKNVEIGTVPARATHPIFRVNGVKFVVAQQGDSYTLIADEFEINPDRLLSYNDLVSSQVLEEGTRIYIDKKKNKAPTDCPSHVVLPGESMYSISQDYGVKVIKLYDMNNMLYDQGVQVGMELKLR